MTNSFTFVDELPQLLGKRARDPLIIEFAEACIAHPGQWGEYPKPLKLSTARTYAVGVNKGYASVPGCLGNGEFEAVVREGALWVRSKK